MEENAKSKVNQKKNNPVYHISEGVTGCEWASGIIRNKSTSYTEPFKANFLYGDSCNLEDHLTQSNSILVNSLSLLCIVTQRRL